LDALNNVQEFFASYEGEGECDNVDTVDKTENPLQWSSLALDEEIGAAAGEDDDFEKI